ncbi:MAG: sel1 repeat family protein [Natronospirillum sp.]
MSVRKVMFYVLTSVALVGGAPDTLLASQGELVAEEKVQETYRQAEAFRLGARVDKNIEEAVRLHSLLASQGHAASARSLGALYFYGREVPLDLNRAADYLKQAVDAGDDEALPLLARALGRSNQHAEAYEIAELAVERLGSKAKLQMAMSHLAGEFGKYSDLERGFREASAFAAEGNPQAKLAVAKSHIYGRGTAQDRETGLAMLMALNDEGARSAPRTISGVYLKGIGGPVDLALARSYADQAVAEGDMYAHIYLSELNWKNGDYQAAVASMNKARDAGIGSADLAFARAHHARDFGPLSNRTLGANMIAQLAEDGDLAAARLALRLHERRSQRLTNMDLERVIGHLNVAMEEGDGRATESLLRFYRKLSWAYPDHRARRSEIMASYGDQVRSARRFPEQLQATYDRYQPQKSWAAMADMISEAEGDDYYNGLIEIRYMSQNAFTYVLQNEMRRIQKYGGRPTGWMTRGTLLATMSFCKEAGAYDKCVHGPLNHDSVRAMAAELQSRK